MVVIVIWLNDLGNPKYRKLVENVRDRLVKASQAVGGLYSNTVHIDGAHFAQGDGRFL